MATGLNMFSLVEELSSPAFRKIAALVSPKRGYPELPDYPTIPALPIHTILETAQQFTVKVNPVSW